MGVPGSGNSVCLRSRLLVWASTACVSGTHLCQSRSAKAVSSGTPTA
jgi:hypothetical protein